MPGAYDRSRNAAVVRQISANFDSAISDFFGTRRLTERRHRVHTMHMLPPFEHMALMLRSYRH